MLSIARGIGLSPRSAVFSFLDRTRSGLQRGSSFYVAYALPKPAGKLAQTSLVDSK